MLVEISTADAAFVRRLLVRSADADRDLTVSGEGTLFAVDARRIAELFPSTYDDATLAADPDAIEDANCAAEAMVDRFSEYVYDGMLGDVVDWIRRQPGNHSIWRWPSEGDQTFANCGDIVHIATRQHFDLDVRITLDPVDPVGPSGAAPTSGIGVPSSLNEE